MSKLSDTIRIINKIRQETDTAVLFYSAGGKDSIALLDMLAKRFEHVICYYMYLIPDLDHIRPYIQFAETYGNVEVRQIKHYQADVYEKCGIFCDTDESYYLKRNDPNRKKERSVGDVEEWVRQDSGQHYVFSGMKGIDGYMKRMRLLMYAKTGYVRKEGMVYPLAVWTNKEVLAYIRMNKLPRPFVYAEGDVSQGFVINTQVMLLMRKYYPNDYQKILEQYPYSIKLVVDYDEGRVDEKGRPKEKDDNASGHQSGDAESNQSR